VYQPRQHLPGRSGAAGTGHRHGDVVLISHGRRVPVRNRLTPFTVRVAASPPTMRRTCAETSRKVAVDDSSADGAGTPRHRRSTSQRELDRMLTLAQLIADSARRTPAARSRSSPRRSGSPGRSGKDSRRRQPLRPHRIDEVFGKGQKPFGRQYGDPAHRPNVNLGQVEKAPSMINGRTGVTMRWRRSSRGSSRGSRWVSADRIARSGHEVCRLAAQNRDLVAQYKDFDVLVAERRTPR
jgi:hypothetical protein